MKRSVLVWSCCASLLMPACGDDAPKTPDTSNNPSTPDPGPKPNPTLTVTGKVLGVPRGSTLSVLIPGEGRQPVSVDGSGAFSISGVTAPYQLVLAQKRVNSAIVYQGLSLTDLTLHLPGSTGIPSGPDRSASFEGQLTGGAASAFSRVSFVSPNGKGEKVTFTNDYAVDVDWAGSSTLTGSVYALQFEHANGDYSSPSRYLGFGQRDNVTLTAGGKLSAQDIAVSPVTNATLSGRITVPATYSAPMLLMNMMPRPDTEVPLFGQEFSGEGAFTFAVPQIAQTTYSMTLVAFEQRQREDEEVGRVFVFKRGLGAGALAAPVVIPEAARLDKPADAARDVTRSSTFSWSAFAQGVHAFYLEQDTDKALPYSVTVYTRESQVTLPDLSALGMTLPTNANFSWGVLGFAPAASVDAYVGLSAQGDFFTSTAFKDLAVGFSRRQTFTTTATP